MTDERSGPAPDLLVTGPLPAPAALPADYDRHRPTIEAQQAVLRDLVGGTDWPALSWPRLIERLLMLGRTDIPLSRLAEGHVDAVRILDQAGRRPVPDALYGVWASRSQQTGVRAQPGPDGRLRLSGTLMFASGAGLLERALIPVWLDDGRHLLLDLPAGELPVDTTRWRTGAMAPSRTHQVTFEAVDAAAETQAGPADFYLHRPGFFPGGIGVAACWAGGAARLLDLLQTRLPDPSPPQRLRFGRIRTDLVAAVCVVRAAADRADLWWNDPAGPDSRPWQELATEARSAVAAGVRRIVAEARTVGGAAGMALDDDLGHAVADLELYALQQSSDSDAAVLGDPGRRA